jgi:hypothetical protein
MTMSTMIPNLAEATLLVGYLKLMAFDLCFAFYKIEGAPLNHTQCWLHYLLLLFMNLDGGLVLILQTECPFISIIQI